MYLEIMNRIHDQTVLLAATPNLFSEPAFRRSHRALDKQKDRLHKASRSTTEPEKYLVIIKTKRKGGIITACFPSRECQARINTAVTLMHNPIKVIKFGANQVGYCNTSQFQNFCMQRSSRTEELTALYLCAAKRFSSVGVIVSSRTNQWKNCKNIILLRFVCLIRVAESR